MTEKPWEIGTDRGNAAPVQILDDVYFVGTQPASTHIIDTGDGLIMLDTGYRQTLHLVLHHMWQLGLDPANLKYILHTHGHIDHMGATAALVQLTGAKTFLGAADRAYATGQADLSYAAELGMCFDEPFVPDVLLNNGDVVTLGRTQVRCVATPGHTPGCMTFFFDGHRGGAAYRCALHGGMGINTMSRAFLDKYGLSHSCRDAFLQAMDRLAKEPVDVFLGNHMQHNDTPGKTARVLAGDPLAFVDPSEWVPYLQWCKQNLLNMLAQEESHE